MEDQDSSTNKFSTLIINILKIRQSSISHAKRQYSWMTEGIFAGFIFKVRPHQNEHENLIICFVFSLKFEKIFVGQTLNDCLKGD